MSRGGWREPAPRCARCRDRACTRATDCGWRPAAGVAWADFGSGRVDPGGCAVESVGACGSGEPAGSRSAALSGSSAREHSCAVTDRVWCRRKFSTASAHKVTAAARRSVRVSPARTASARNSARPPSRWTTLSGCAPGHGRWPGQLPTGGGRRWPGPATRAGGPGGGAARGECQGPGDGAHGGPVERCGGVGLLLGELGKERPQDLDAGRQSTTGHAHSAAGIVRGGPRNGALGCAGAHGRGR